MIEDVLNAKFSRRDFLKGTLAATAAAAGLGIANGGENRLKASAEGTAPAGAPVVSDAAEGGKWVAAPCWHNCGGKCLVRAYVKDGVILRQGTDSFNTDDEVNRQQRACLRGFSQQYQARGLDRLKYPMKRKHWSPDDRNPELRGQDEWERISWDEAATYIHDELERINTTYGDNAILTFGGGCSSLLNKLNINYLNSWTTSSWGTWFAPGVLG